MESARFTVTGCRRPFKSTGQSMKVSKRPLSQLAYAPGFSYSRVFVDGVWAHARPRSVVQPCHIRPAGTLRPPAPTTTTSTRENILVTLACTLPVASQKPAPGGDQNWACVGLSGTWCTIQMSTVIWHSGAGLNIARESFDCRLICVEFLPLSNPPWEMHSA